MEGTLFAFLPIRILQQKTEISKTITGPTNSLFDSMRELSSFTDYLLLQNIEGELNLPRPGVHDLTFLHSQDPRNIAHIIAISLKALEKLQLHVLNDILGAFDISSEGHSSITFESDDLKEVDTTE